ncbi:hypothetical protein FSP39_009475 [Pinctada imbricata]|uniref:Uncharacterized protein n=1 Tax=Pinctada imbricata TaxID=66713 RepID=A0AA88XY34_PINIB|nr:hypothetical protein FSP39_009475 [Pinctada imbricata]
MDSSATQQFCYFLSFTVTLTCFVVKVPQILSIVQSKSCKGVSLSSLILEECGYSVMLTYNFAKEYPFSAYSEYPFLVLQGIPFI